MTDDDAAQIEAMLAKRRDVTSGIRLLSKIGISRNVKMKAVIHIDDYGHLFSFDISSHKEEMGAILASRLRDIEQSLLDMAKTIDLAQPTGTKGR